MGKKVVKTLYFVTGVKPTEEQQAEIDAMPGNVCVRNAVKIREEETLEDFDYVAGDVPPAYAAAAAAKKGEEGDGPADPPKASTSAPAAPQQAQAKPSGKAGTAWKPN